MPPNVSICSEEDFPLAPWIDLHGKMRHWLVFRTALLSPSAYLGESHRIYPSYCFAQGQANKRYSFHIKQILVCGMRPAAVSGPEGNISP